MPEDSENVSNADMNWNLANRGIHSNQPPVISAPALVCHVVFWRSKLNPIKSNMAFLQNSEANIDDSIVSWGGNDYVNVNPRTNDKSLRDGEFQRVVEDSVTNFDIYIDEIPSELRIEVHAEYITYTVVAHIGRIKCERYQFPEASHHVIANKILGIFKEPNFCSNDFLFHQLWLDCSPMLLRINNALTGEDGTGTDRIGDFRGLVVRDAGEMEGYPFRQLFSQSLPSRKGVVATQAKRSWAKERFQKWWANGLDSWGQSALTEYSATAFLDGNALFVTTLGADQFVAGAGSDDRKKHVRFMLDCHNDDAWQTGRLVQRICAMGTARIALGFSAARLMHRSDATDTSEAAASLPFAGHARSDQVSMMIDSLEVAERVIDIANNRLYEKKLDRSMEGAEPIIELIGLHRSDREANIRKLGSLFSDFEKVSENLQKMKSIEIPKITSEFWNKIEAAYRSVRDGQSSMRGDELRYRIERARFYYRRYLTLAEQTRPRRLEGFQTYDEFVRRRMGDHIAHVEAIRSRMIDMDDLFDRQAKRVDSLYQKATEIDADEQQRKIEEIQDFGEFALIVFLIPYYAGYSISYPLAKMLGYDTIYGGFLLSLISMLVFLIRARNSGDGNIFSSKEKQMFSWNIIFKKSKNWPMVASVSDRRLIRSSKIVINWLWASTPSQFVYWLIAVHVAIVVYTGWTKGLPYVIGVPSH